MMFLIAVFYLFGPTNEIDNALGLHRQNMIECTLKWGRLAPFPELANDFSIRTEGNAFTRTFRGSFSSSPEVIRRWLEHSPGVQEGQQEKIQSGAVHYILSTGGGAAYGEITIDKDGTHVDFRVSWS